ncbi:SWIM zinc finger family protein [Halosimplex halobium]|uniref:SWIM zinc finger family protein n=1 Tax=Halosimplex halobium TaxID=3396618 RepID=UPI003F5490D0
MRLSLAEADYDPSCSCPYDGPGHCKHVVAVLLSVADDVPSDEGDRIDDAFETVDDEALRAFVRDELARTATCSTGFSPDSGPQRGSLTTSTASKSTNCSRNTPNNTPS